VKVLKLILNLNIYIVSCTNDSEYKIVIITIVEAVVIVTW
jgi:hypothetical protein